MAQEDAGPVGQDAITLQSLLRKMADVRHLAEFPEPAFEAEQASSYDRRSTTPEQTGTKGWFANLDRGQFIRTEERDGRKEFVMMDAQGPGAVVRIWSANPRGTLRIYLDGSEQPTWEGPMHMMLSMFPVPHPIAGVRGRGYNLYLPIPYAESCKITVDDGQGLYYLINYRTYPAETPVQTFTRQQLMVSRPLMREVADQLEFPRGQTVTPHQEAQFRVELAAGESTEIASFTGGNAISLFEVLTSFEGEQPGDVSVLEQGLRSLVLKMTFDGEQTVEAPLGDFFGAAPGINPYRSLPLTVTREGRMISRWVMPFRESATIEVANLGETAATLKGRVGTVPYEWTDRTMHFHAGYRSAYDMPTRPYSDWNYLTIRGKGVFVGASLTIDNPARRWWGEGDEKIYIDGGDFPDWFGTGTEDYFGYAWSYTSPYEGVYHSQPRIDGPKNYGRTSNNRFHVLDRIPFEESFRFDMELWHWEDVKVNQAVTCYWYARPGATDEYAELEAKDLVVRPMPPYDASRDK